MTTAMIADTVSVHRLQLLLSAMTFREKHYRALAEADRIHGDVQAAYDNEAVATHAAWVAYRTRGHLATISGLTADDAEQLAAIQPTDEPPTALVPLVDWLRARWGQWFPWVPAETWQTVGMLLLRGRP